MTIEERAIEYDQQKITNRPYSDSMSKYEKENYTMELDGYIEDYKDIANEQRDEDIQRAKQWLKEFLYDTDEENPILESLERAMKGE